MVCLSSNFEDETTLNLPPKVKVLALPKPMTLQNAIFDYAAKHEQQGQSITVHRSFSLHHAGSVCSAEEFNTLMRPALDKMLRDLKAQVILESVD